MLNKVQNELGHALGCQAWLYHLFGEEENTKYLKRHVREFWGDIKHALLADLFTTIGRLTDPPRMNGRENVSVQKLLEAQGLTPDLVVKGKRAVRLLRREHDAVHVVRNRVFSHTDFEAVVGDSPTFKPIAVDDYLKAMADLLGEIGREIEPEYPAFNWGFFVEKNIDDLMFRLRNGQK